MTDRSVYRGDDYYADERPLFTTTFLNNQGGPFDLSGSGIVASYAVQVSTPQADPNDENADIRHEIQFDENGDVAYAVGFALPGGGVAADGVIVETLTSQESLALQVGVPYLAGMTLIDAAGRRHTWLFDETLHAKDGITHRSLTVL